MKGRASKSNKSDGNEVKKSDEEERDLTTVRIQHDPVWKLNEKILCNWKCRGVFYKAVIVGIVQYEDEPVYVVNYPGYRHPDEKVLQSEAFKLFIPITDENVKKAKGIYGKAIKMAENKRKSKTSIARKGSIDSSPVASSQDTPVRRGRQPGKTSSKRGRKSVKRSDSNSTASLIDSFMPSAKRPKISRQNAMNTSEDSVVPATPESESPVEAENAGILPKKLKEIFEMDRHKVEIDYKLPVVPARFSVMNIINEYIGLLKGRVDEDRMKPDEARSENSSIFPDKSLISCAVLVAEELLRCFDKSTVERLLYYYEKPYFESLSKGKLQLSEPEDENRENVKETAGSAEEEGTEPLEFSSILGLPYLLRLIENFSEVLLERKDWTLTDTNSSICIQHFVNYLMERADELYNGYRDYFTPSLQYFERNFAK